MLTGGGDCPGLNAAIRAVVARAANCGYEVYAIESGWAGAIEGWIRPIRVEEVRYIIGQGGTIIHTSRTKALYITSSRDKNALYQRSPKPISYVVRYLRKVSVSK